MRKRFLTLSVLLSTLSSCFQGGQQESLEKSKEELHEIPMSVPPFLACSFEQARLLAKRTDKRFLVLIIEPDTDLKELAPKIGVRKDALAQWKRDFVCLVLAAENEDAQKLMEEHYVKALPASIKFTRGDQRPEGVLYGRLWPGSKPYLSEAPMQKLMTLFEEGDRDRRLLEQALDHLGYLPMELEEREDWAFKLKNAYLNSFSEVELKSYAVYQMLKGRLDDVRLDLLKVFFEQRSEMNEAYVKLVEERGLKNKIDADWMIRNAVRKSYDRAVRLADKDLFALSHQKREAFEQGYMDEWMAKDIFLFQLKTGTDEQILDAAIQYFDEKEHWSYSREYSLMELGAFYVNKLSTDPEILKKAEKWISTAISNGKPTPTRYEIHASILDKLEESEKALAVREKLAAYRENFQKFIQLYPQVVFPIPLEEENIKKKAYKTLSGISNEFEDFRSYIRVESSLFKQSEKIEPIAILSKDNEKVELLSRVHLVTGSLLLVRHFRSYYIRSSFTLNGAFLEREYVRGEELKN